MDSRRKVAIGLLFAACAAFFLERGPYRGIRFATSYDFATLYAAGRCWLAGENPYESTDLKKQLAQSGAPAGLIDHQDVNPSLYFVTAMPLVALLAPLPWNAANVAWCLLSVASFAISLLMIIKHSDLRGPSRWLVACASLLFCPTYVGVLYGNPAVLTSSLVLLVVLFSLDGRWSMGGLLLGIALSLKPQIAVCAVCVLAVWTCWSPILMSFTVFGTTAVIGILRLSALGRDWQWWHSQQRNIALVMAPGGRGDPSLANPWSSELLNAQTIPALVLRNPLVCDALVWGVAALLVFLYFYFRKKSSETYSWLDAGFFCAIATAVVYHRYCDGQIFLLLIPLLSRLWQVGDRKIALSLGACLLLLAFPSQSVLPKLLGPSSTKHAWEQLMLLRHQPLAVLVIALIVIWIEFRQSELTLPGNRNFRALRMR